MTIAHILNVYLDPTFRMYTMSTTEQVSNNEKKNYSSI